MTNSKNKTRINNYSENGYSEVSLKTQCPVCEERDPASGLQTTEREMSQEQLDSVHMAH